MVASRQLLASYMLAGKRLGRFSMAFFKATVYSPPKEGLPPVAVIFDGDGDVLMARSVRSIEAGEVLINKLLHDLQETIDLEKK